VGQRLEAYLVLGCNGFIGEDGFRSCYGIENPIIDLTKVPEDEYNSLLEFLDNACDLFSRPINDYNKCVNTLSLLYKIHNAYDKQMLHNIQNFLKMHKQCGVSLILVMKEDINGQ
jgi:hypothetical protein